LSDVSPEVRDEASPIILRSLDEGVERGKLDEKGKRHALACLELEQDMMTAVSGAALVIEAAPEWIELECTIGAYDCEE
jgi:3-hydroxyacyl-CoA dehydrogenase